jgi:hypothetical protein
MQDYLEIIKTIAPPLFGALAAYLAIREDLAVLKRVQAMQESEIGRLRDRFDSLHRGHE